MNCEHEKWARRREPALSGRTPHLEDAAVGAEGAARQVVACADTHGWLLVQHTCWLARLPKLSGSKQLALWRDQGLAINRRPKGQSPEP